MSDIYCGGCEQSLSRDHFYAKKYSMKYSFRYLLATILYSLTISICYGNDYYTHGSYPSVGSPPSSAAMRAELDLISAGFDKLPLFTGNASKAVIVNGAGTAMTVTAIWSLRFIKNPLSQ